MERIFTASLLTGAKHPSAFSSNHLPDINKTEHNYIQEQYKNLKAYTKTTNIITYAQTKALLKKSLITASG